MAIAQEMLKAQKRFTKVMERAANPDDPLNIRDINAFLQRAYEGEFWDELAAYRRIKGLIVIGPPEIEKAFLGPRSENVIDTPNPRGWCPQVEVPWFPSQLKALVELCKTPEWETTPVLWLCIPDYYTPASLIRQYYWWGAPVPFGKHPGGLFRKNIMFHDNWFCKLDELWVNERPSKEPVWKIGYGMPKWSMEKSWEDQAETALNRGLTISSAVSDALMMNLVQIATGKNLRAPKSEVRTATNQGSQQITVGAKGIFRFSGDSYLTILNKTGHYASANLGLAAEGLPSEISGK